MILTHHTLKIYVVYRRNKVNFDAMFGIFVSYAGNFLSFLLVEIVLIREI